MTPKQFFDLVSEMRAAQKKYFSLLGKPERYQYLQKSKDLEKRVDAEIERANAILANRAQQLALDFNNDNGNGAAQSN